MEIQRLSCECDKYLPIAIGFAITCTRRGQLILYNMTLPNTYLIAR